MSAQPQDSLDGTVTPLAAALAERGLSARRLARAAGVHENSVYAWRSGRSSPSYASAGRVAAVLGVPAIRLFPGLTPAAAPQPDRGPRLVATAVQRLSDDERAERSAQLSRRLAETMTVRQLNVGQLAQAAGITRRTVHRYLSGHSLAPNPDTAARLAAALDVHPDQLVAPLPASPLAQAVAQRGWDTRQLAAAVDVHEDAAQEWIAGRRVPQRAIAARLAAALDRPLAELFDVAPTPEPARDAGREVRRLPTVDQVLTAPATGRDDWAGDAACAQPDHDPEAWWPAQTDPAHEARATCGGCPVQGDCRDSYLAGPDTPDTRTAIWAGLPGGRLRSLARAHATATAREVERGEDRAVDAAAAPRPTEQRATRAQPAAAAALLASASGAARADGPVDPEAEAAARARMIRPASSAAPRPRDPHPQPRHARGVPETSARTARDDDAPQGEQTERSAPSNAIGRQAARQPVGATAGMTR